MISLLDLVYILPLKKLDSLQHACISNKLLIQGALSVLGIIRMQCLCYRL